MSKPPLGRLKRIALREYWEREDTGFTPWLAEEENVALLSEAIGLELEVQATEASVGPFRADVLCRDTADGSLVLVENQIERTDHSHLGQVMTYAAGLGAVTVVWIAKRFTEEHRAALDWLNEISRDEIRFFGLEVELWQIGDSVPAPKFNVVAKPNDWTREVREAATSPRGPHTETQQLYQDYWRSFVAFNEERGSRFRMTTPTAGSWWGWGIGKTGYMLVARITARSDEAGVFLAVKGPGGSARFDALQQDDATIERELGFAVDWLPKPGRKESQISTACKTTLQDRSAWPDLHRWMVERLEGFDRVFRPRVRVLPVTDTTSEDAQS